MEDSDLNPEAIASSGLRTPWRAVAWLGVFRVGGLVIGIAVIWIVFASLNANFFTQANILELLRAMSSLAIIAIGETFVIISGELDLSVGAVYGLAAMVMGTVWVNGTVDVYLALLIGLGVGLAAGALNAFIVTVVRIPSFIVTLGTLSIVQGLTLWVSGAMEVNPAYATPPVNHQELSVFTTLGGYLLPFNVPIQVAWLVGIAIVCAVLLHRSLFGFRLTAIGGNTDAARIARLAISRYKFVVFMLCGLLAAVAGILDFSFLGATDPNSGLTLTFPVFAAVIIGGASLAGGRGTVVGTLSGALLLQSLTNGLNIVGVGPYVQLIFVGSVTIAAVALDRLTQLRRRAV
jgi:ribose/xylose/arabinose/galactoside ABC-type transport system permease subunit